MVGTKIKIAAILIALTLLGAGCANQIDVEETSSALRTFMEEKVGPAISEWFKNNQAKALNVFNKTRESAGKGLSEEQRAAIDEWLNNNNLNQYGDSRDTVYAGGTPLFNESTGESIERFEYLFKKFPNLIDVASDAIQENLKN